MTQTTSYRHMLAAVELDEAGEQVAVRAQTLAQHFGARLSLLHVISYVPLDSGEAMVALPLNYMADMEQNARQRLDQLCTKLGLNSAAAKIASGAVVSQVLDAAVEGGVDLIVLGHHTRRGLMALFSHTDEDVVARAPCDVLALKLP